MRNRARGSFALRILREVSVLDLIIIGAGHAGLSASHTAAAAGLEHLVLEKGDVGQTWRSQRWDSFTMNTPNAMNPLAGSPYAGVEPEGFERRDEWVARLERYANDHALPLRRWTEVTAVEQDEGGFVVETQRERLNARNVIVAAGSLTTPKLPAAARTLDPRIERITAGGYRNPAQLPPGAILVVGSGQSGVQIAEDLLDAGREVYLSTSQVPRAPRRLRGRDIFVWLDEIGWWDQRPSDLPDPAMRSSPNPQISGVGQRGHTVSLQWLAARGAYLLGRLEAADGPRVRMAADLAQHIAFADAASRRMRAQVDDHIARRGIAAPASEPDPADEPVADPGRFAAPTELDLVERGVRSVIFSSGFTADLSWLRVPTFDDRGAPLNVAGRSPVDGLWFLGLQWQRKRKSGIVWGMPEDSAEVVSQVLERARSSAGLR